MKIANHQANLKISNMNRIEQNKRLPIYLSEVGWEGVGKRKFHQAVYARVMFIRNPRYLTLVREKRHWNQDKLPRT